MDRSVASSSASWQADYLHTDKRCRSTHVLRNIECEPVHLTTHRRAPCVRQPPWRRSEADWSAAPPARPCVRRSVDRHPAETREIHFGTAMLAGSAATHPVQGVRPQPQSAPHSAGRGREFSESQLRIWPVARHLRWGRSGAAPHRLSRRTASRSLLAVPRTLRRWQTGRSTPQESVSAISLQRFSRGNGLTFSPSGTRSCKRSTSQ